MIFRLFSALVFLTLSLAATLSHALEGHYDVWNQTLDEQIKQLSAQDNTPEIVKELDTLQNAKGMIENAVDFDEKTQSYRQLIEEFPALSDKLKQQVDNFATTKFPDFRELSQKELADAIKQQDAKIKQLEQSRNSSKNELGSIENGIDEFSSRSTQLRDLIKQEEQALRQIESQPNTTNQQLVHQISHQYYVSELYMLEAEQLSAGNRRTLVKQHIQLQNLEIDARLAYRNTLQRELSRQQRLDTDITSEENGQFNLDLDNQPDSLRQLTISNKRYIEALKGISSLSEQVQQGLTTSRQQIRDVESTADDLETMAEWLKLSPAFSENLRTRISRLPANPPIEQLDKDIAQNQIKKYEYQQLADSLKESNSSPSTGNLNEEQLLQEHALIEANQILLEKLIDQTDTLIYQQATLKVSYEQLNSNINDLHASANKQLFWAPDTNPVNINFVIVTWEKLKWFFSPYQWVGFIKFPVVVDKVKLSFALTIIAAIILGLSWCRKSWKRYLTYTSKKIGKVTQDSFRYSYNNVFFSFLLAWPVPIIVGLVGQIFSSGWQYPFVYHLGQALTLPMALVMFCFIRELVRPNGLLVSHFEWEHDLIGRCFTHYKQLLWVYLPMMVIQQFAHLYSDIDVNATLGRLAFIISNISISYFLWRMCKEKLPMTYGNLPEGKAHIGHHLFWWTLILVPQGLNYTALKGYLSSSQDVMHKLEFSAVIGVITILIYYLVKRLMLIQKRRLAFERAKAKRQEIIAQRIAEVEEDKEEHFGSNEMQIEIEEPEVDLDKISAQSLRLLRSLLLLIYLACLSTVWADFYQAISYLGEVTLWDVTNKIDGINEISAISVSSVLLGLIAVWLTAIVARDLPGAMELLILQHLELSPGTGYAITSLTRYIAIIMGILISSGLVGFDWSKMQWLVAALGVGLGFGLQEIFANFISGLIILFERPIRIGDTITIRNLTGIIAKINTRATTIVDFDRKEVIVPNKAFVTEQFVNWSLSDPITRVTLSISVNYSANTDLVTKLLFEATEECDLVLDNPAPEVFFLTLTADSQNFEVRAYAAETSHRLSLTHDLHNRIKEKFNLHDIQIANPQLEIQMKRRRTTTS
ncbi:miniconductance mechanosensitive channel MscM [Photobacterium sp. ZSDE20]|uniref:Miniconductance mechanosensitive channel MscM n=1 Tax=Photobacterium pectinilyticum TaxID=2906793 RepID=A0ABT1NAN2_9GAMM|nr:miniconductance mechanosensitive channel MscM [Photobacterium sp. ZSDE20]MCQ1060899.1 miniconductance mechanosensitive channel MscM [Photobacterium sp. ZSDE20]MDD1828705.1 miniconductance mechanosensitive channel MscM [Photobacterium sp. ZSDE20]